MPAGLEVTLEDLHAFLNRTAEDMARVDLSGRPGRVIAMLMAADFKRNIAEGHGPDGTPYPPLAHARPSGGSGIPLRNNGLLLASLGPGGAKHVERIDATSVEAGTAMEYAQTHQEGATIRPVKGKALAIPLTREAARAGTARDFPGQLFVVKGRDNAFLAERKERVRRGKTVGEIIRHYVLTDEVTIPERPFVGWSERLLGQVGNVVAEEAERKGGS